MCIRDSAESLYLNMLGRAPNASESRNAVTTLRRNDNRIARLRLFESLVQSSEYKRAFTTSDSSWQVFRAPDYNYNNGAGFYPIRQRCHNPKDSPLFPMAGDHSPGALRKALLTITTHFATGVIPALITPSLHATAALTDLHKQSPATHTAVLNSRN